MTALLNVREAFGKTIVVKTRTSLGGIPVGVEFKAPPLSILAEATRVIESMTAQLPPDAHGAILGVATEHGWNAAVVHRVGSSFAVASWIGKRWDGGLTGGGAIRAVW